MVVMCGSGGDGDGVDGGDGGGVELKMVMWWG